VWCGLYSRCSPWRWLLRGCDVAPLVGLGVSVARSLDRIIICAAPPRPDLSDIMKPHEPPERSVHVGAERIAQFLFGDPGALAHQCVDSMCNDWHEHRMNYSLASAPSNGTRRGLMRVLNAGPVASHAAPGRPPRPPKHRIRRSPSPTVAARFLE
jgi:hypothetical protein